MSETVLDIQDLTKTYRGRPPTRANRGIDFRACAGEVVGLLGHNGAGKTTMVNQIVGLLRPDSGSIRIADCDAVANPQEARRLVSVQAQANVPITGITPRVAVNLVGRIRGGKRVQVAQRTEALLTALDLGAWADKPSQSISGGVARLTAFAMAVVAPGRLVILDEPTNDVDPARRRLLWQLIRQVADDGAAVLLVTHNVREAESAVDQLVILDHGAVIASGTPEQLTGQVRSIATPADPTVIAHNGSPSLEDVYLELVGGSEQTLEHSLPQKAVS